MPDEQRSGERTPAKRGARQASASEQAPASAPADRSPRPASETDEERRVRRAQFLRELAEARELRRRVQPRRTKAARLRHSMRMRTFRW